jgi:hypothetical protein
MARNLRWVCSPPANDEEWIIAVQVRSVGRDYGVSLGIVYDGESLTGPIPFWGRRARKRGMA